MKLDIAGEKELELMMLFLSLMLLLMLLTNMRSKIEFLRRDREMRSDGRVFDEGDQEKTEEKSRHRRHRYRVNVLN